MRFSTLAEWLSWQEQLHLSEIDLGLGRVGEVADRLSLTTSQLKPAKIITVAGTNGKGSCVATIEKILVAAGIKVGAYTSPHLNHYCERIRLNGDMANEQDVCEAFAAIDKARGDISLTYFEFGTLAALWVFAKYKLDVLVLEVGLGGRLDAVNIVDPDIAVITTIDIDHSDWLGNDRENIGLEKAGILRPGVPLVYADDRPVPSIMNQAQKLVCPTYLWNQDFFAEQSVQVSEPQARGIGWMKQILTWSGKTNAGKDKQIEQLPGVSLPLLSVAAGLQVLHLLQRDWNKAVLVQGLTGLQLAGRAQLVENNGKHFLLDVAHNPAAAQLLRTKLTELMPKPARLVAVVGMMADKDIAATLEPFLPIVDQWYCCDLPMPRAAKANVIAKILAEQGQNGRVCKSVGDALAIVSNEQGPNDLVVVMGSFITVGAAMAVINQQN